MMRMLSKARVVYFTSLFAVMVAVMPAGASTFLVCADGSGDYLTIQEAINAAVNGDEVVVCDGIFTGAGNRDLDFGGRNIAVRSLIGPIDCILDCEGVYAEHHRGFHFHGGETPDAVVEGFTIRNGHADVGGAIFCEFGSSPTISRCIIRDNAVLDYGTGGTGGGVCAYGSSPTVTSCIIRDNSAASGGGIYGYEGDLIIQDCLISGNTANYGGGVYGSYCTPSLSDCVVAQNVAGNNGGGVCFFYANAAVTNCLFTGNVSTTSQGGAFYCNRSSPVVVNCTITANQAAGSGGALRCASSSHPSFTNGIFWGDSPGEMSIATGCNPVFTYCDVQGGWTGVGNINLDPRFVAGSYHLAQIAAGQAENSPCVDAGNPAGAVINGTTRTDGVPDAAPVDLGYHYPITEAARLGDLNCDGAVDVADIEPFVAVLMASPPDYTEYYAAYPGCDHLLADCNEDGAVDGLDLGFFATLLLGG